MLGNLFHVVLYQPIFNLFIGLYNIIPGHDLTLVILVLTIIIRLIVSPLTLRYVRAQQSMLVLNPKLEAIKKEYAADKQKQAQAIMELYKQHKVNPFTSCLPLLLQLPIIIALYRVLSTGIVTTDVGSVLYPFVSNPGRIDTVSFFGFLNLAKSGTTANFVVALLAGIAQFIQAKIMTTPKAPTEAGKAGEDENMAATMNKQMMYVMPLMTVFIGTKLPAGLAIYWLLSTALMILERFIINRWFTPPALEAAVDVVPTPVGTTAQKIDSVVNEKK